MSPENKQRIVGVVVLVAFIALLVPFLFTSGIKKKLSAVDEIPINAQKRQLITKQIQSINSAAATTTTVATTAALPVPAPAATVAAIPQPVTAEQLADTTQLPKLSQDQQFEQPDMLLPPENNQTEPPSQPMATVAPTEKAATNTASVVPQATNESTASVEASTPEVSKAVAPVKATPKNKAIKKSKAVPKIKTKIKTKDTQLINTTVSTNAKGSWSVQVGSFSDETHTQKLITQLHSNGFHVYTQKITTATGSLTRVLVGREESKEKASQIAGQLETTMKIKGRLIRNKK